MARPPLARRAPYTTGTPSAGRRDLDVLPHEFADFVRMERELASTELGFPVADDTNAQGDLAGTVMEMSALVAHILGLYQDRYGSEVFLGTAQFPASLVKHGRRLAYEPSPGVTASGYIALFAKPGLRGTIPERFAFSSGAVGEKPPQDYELVAPAEVDAATNVLLPRDSVESIAGGVITGGAAPPMALDNVHAAGADLDLRIGDVVVVAWEASGVLMFEARYVTSVASDVALDETAVGLSAEVLVPYGVAVWLHARPALDVHAFAHDAPTILDTVSTYNAPSGVAATDLFLDREVDVALAGQPIVRISGQTLTPLRLAVNGSGPRQESVHVKLQHVSSVSTSVEDPTSGTTITHNLTPEVNFARSVTRVTLETPTTPAVLFNRPAIVDRLSRYLADWQLRAAVRTSRPAVGLVGLPLVLAKEHPSFLPGRLFAFEAIGDDEGKLPSQVARVRSALAEHDTTTVLFDLVDPAETLAAFRLGHVRVLGNVGRVTHGKTVVETLGDSDGVSPFQRLHLAKTPVAHSLSRNGTEPQLEVRVGGALFGRVLDFVEAGTTDPVYVTERDDAGVVSIVFGDGKNGAIPPSGKRHIQAVYRKGIGPLGNADALAVNKVAKAHPVLERAYNPTPVRGGVEPASSDDVRTEAPLYLATFDRAVSVADHARLARRCAGVARARAVLGETRPGVEGVLVIIADRTGDAANVDAVRAFLRDRRDNTLPFEVVKPDVIDVTLTIGVLFDPAFDKEEIKLELLALLTSEKEDAPGLLTFGARDLGQPLFASQIVEWIERLPGIVAFRLLAFAIDPNVPGATNPPSAVNPVEVPPATLDVVRADANEWIRLRPAGLFIETISEAS